MSRLTPQEKRQIHAWLAARPLIHAIAEWEAKHGAVCCITPLTSDNAFSFIKAIQNVTMLHPARVAASIDRWKWDPK